MSTKIFDAFVVTDPAADVFDVCERLHRLITPAFERLRAELVTNRTIRVIDDAAISREPQPERGMPFLQARRTWMREQSEKNPSHYDHDPLRFEAAIARTGDGRLLVKAFCQEPQYTQAMAEDPMFADYSYWDNTDAPKGMNDQEWEARMRDWDEVYDPDCALAKAPSWALPRSLSRAFDFAAVKHEAADPDLVAPPLPRLRRAVTEILMSRFSYRGMDLEAAVDLHADAVEFAAELTATLGEDDAWMPASPSCLTATWAEVELPVWPTVEQILSRARDLGIAVPATLADKPDSPASRPL